MQKMQIRFLGQEDPLEKKMATHSNILAWEIPWTEDPGRLLPSSVQSLSRVRLFATPWIATCQASLSIINSQSLLKLMSIKSVMPSNHLILCHPLLLLPPFPASIRVFSSESILCMRWPKYWSFSYHPWGPKRVKDDSATQQQEKAKTIKATINWDLVKLKSFCITNETINKMKRQPTDWEKIFVNDMPNKELIFKIYLYTKNNPQTAWLKMDRRNEQTFLQRSHTDG